jgi:futalosine hydrolase
MTQAPRVPHGPCASAGARVSWAPAAERTARRRALRGAGVVLLTATELEAGPLLPMLRGARSQETTGGRWVRGRLGSHGMLLVVGGYDKANTAHSLTGLFEVGRPPLLVQIGIAGAYPGAGLAVRDLIIADEEVYADTGSSLPAGGWLPTEDFGVPLFRTRDQAFFNRIPLARPVAEAARAILMEAAWPEPRPRIGVGRCLTLSCVTGAATRARALERRWKPLGESMEGAAAAHICALYGVPFLEVRAVSNLVGDRRREDWDVSGAAARAAGAAQVLCAHLDHLIAAALPPAGESG